MSLLEECEECKHVEITWQPNSTTRFFKSHIGMSILELVKDCPTYTGCPNCEPSDEEERKMDEIKSRGPKNGINLDKAGAKILKTFRRSDVESDKAKYKDNIAWWMNRYEVIITTEAEDIVRNAATMINEAVALRDNAVNLLGQLDKDAMEVEREITRLGGIAFVEQLQPTIKERKAHLDNLYESLTRRQPGEKWGNP